MAGRQLPQEVAAVAGELDAKDQWRGSFLWQVAPSGAQRRKSAAVGGGRSAKDVRNARIKNHNNIRIFNHISAWIEEVHS